MAVGRQGNKGRGITLMGDLLLMAVVGEIGVEPVDEFQPPEYIAKEAGTRYAITHGGAAISRWSQRARISASSGRGRQGLLQDHRVRQ